MNRKPTTLTPSRRIFFGALVALICVLFVAVTGEFGLLYREHRRKPPRLPLMQENPHGTGSYRLRPNLELMAGAKGRQVRIRTNAHGMPWRPVSPDKTAGIRRVAILGDSFAFGLWADGFESSFAGVLDSLTRDRGFEVLNFGVGGYGLGDMDLLLREEVMAFDPDVVVVTVYNGNDFRDTYMGIHKYDIVNGVCVWKDEHVAVATGHDYQGDLWHRARSTLRRHFALYRALQVLKWKVIVAVRGGPTEGGEAPNSHETVTFDSLRVSSHFTQETYWSQRPCGELCQEAVAWVDRELESIYEFTRERGVALAIVAIPYRDQVYVETPAGNGYDIRFPQRHLERFAADHQVPYLDLLPVLRERVRAGAGGGPRAALVYQKRDVHFNPRGHRWVGEIMAEWFLRDVVGDVPAEPSVEANGSRSLDR